MRGRRLLTANMMRPAQEMMRIWATIFTLLWLPTAVAQTSITYDNFATIIKLESDMTCNKVTLQNGHIWALPSGDLSGRWELLLTLYAKGASNIAMATSNDPYYALKSAVPPMTLCQDADDKAPTAYPNPASIYSQ